MIVCLEGSEITREHIKKAIQLDRRTYVQQYWLELETCIEYQAKNPHIYTLIYDDEREEVVGYINMSPITKKLYDAMVSGDTIDTCITGDDIVVPTKGESNYLYLSSIIVSKEYRHQGYGAQLLSSTGKKIARLMADGVSFDGVVADTVSEYGARLCENLGMSRLTQSSHESVIYYRDLSGDNLRDFVERLIHE